MDPDQARVDVREVKSTIGRLLPHGHPLREAFLREADFLTVEEARNKLPIYLRMCLSGQPRPL